ncbi:MAG: hypothetical protein R3B82_02245 [Sandaracinaceae bacterium]
MMTSTLTACAMCTRHLRAETDTCPFCGAPAPATAGRPAALPRMMSRSAILAYGAAVSASLAVGCSESHGPDDAGTAGSDAGGGGADAGGGGADSGTDAGTDAGSDAGTDAGPDGTDAGFDAGEIALPYGAPPLREDWV